MKKRDLILICVLLCLSAAGLAFVKLAQKESGAVVRVTVDGDLYGTYPLDQETEIEVKTDEGMNLIRIGDGCADVTEADCPDRICADHEPIHMNHETIVCLPHRLVVEIEGGEDAGIDAQIR